VTWRGGRLRREEGAGALVEFALVLPILLLVVFGIIEFGFAWYVRQGIANAAREGARWSIVRGSQSGRAATASAVANYVTERMPLRQPGAMQVIVTPASGPGAPGSVVKVVVVYQYQPLAGPWIGVQQFRDSASMIVSR
jgi:Flp pilus assembly protein TadG